MRKTKYTLGLAFLATVATSLSGCFGKKGGTEAGSVSFWSSFGGAYTTVVQGVVDKINSELGYKIEHESHDSYGPIFRDMQSALGNGDYPNIAQGYPDHFAKYMARDILLPLDDYLTQAEINDYYSQYMEENYFWADDGSGVKKIYGLPFNKSTELLGYNGTFVDYCSTINPDLLNIPASWGEWEEKGPLYMNIYKSMFGKKLYGIQNLNGHCNKDTFELLDKDDSAPSGKTLLLDLSEVNATNAYLMSWDSTDNAFITLTRQWRAEYTSLPDTEKTKSAGDRRGHIMFNSSQNQPKVIDMLRFFNRMNENKLFATPAELDGDFSSAAFKACKVMFMICSSGGLSYNTEIWTHRFSVAPIPYKYADAKRVISQGADICLTDQDGNPEDAAKAIKALTTGKYQAEFCLQTGYYPCSKSAFNDPDYQAFLNEETEHPSEAFSNKNRVAYREGSRINSDYYMKESEGWLKFVDPAFSASAILRETIKGVLTSIFTYVAADAEDPAYAAKLNELKTSDALQGEKILWVE